MWKRKYQFTARDVRGRNIIVNVIAVLNGNPDLLMTSEGDLVQDLGGGHYTILDTGEFLLADPVGQAPPA